MATSYPNAKKKMEDYDNFPQDLSDLPTVLLNLCISKAYYMVKSSKNLATLERQKLLQTLMSVDLSWFKIIWQLKHKTAYGVNHVRRSLRMKDYTKQDNAMLSLKKISIKDTDIIPSTSDTEIHRLKGMLDKAIVQKVQLEELLNTKENERHLFETKLNRTLLEKNDLQRRLDEADKNNKCLEVELTLTKNEVAKMLLLHATDEVKLREVKAMFEEAQADNNTLKEEIIRKDNELLLLRERIVSAEDIARLLHQKLNCSENDIHRQKQLLEAATSEHVKIVEEKRQLATENDLLKKEIDKLKEKLDEQSKLIEEKKYESEIAEEKSTTEGSDNDDTPSGYSKAIFAEEVDEKYLCTRCTQILKNPIQSFCGHRFCKECFDHLIREGGGRAICQRCSEECKTAAENTLEESKMFPDNAIRRELNSKPSNCAFENCKWSGTFKEYEKHFEKCDWFQTRCNSCGKKLPKNQFDGHSCRTSTLVGGQPCKYQCGKPVTERDFALHLQRLLPEHLEALYRRTENVFSVLGGHSLPSRRQETLCDWITAIESVVKSFDDKMQNKLSSSAVKGTDSNVIKDQINERSTEQSPTSTSSSLEGPVASAVGGVVRGSSAQTSQANDVIQKLAKLEATMKTCENLLTSLNGEVEHDFRLIENFQAEEETRKVGMGRLDQTLKSIDRVISAKNASLADLDKRVRDLEQTNYGGCLLWRLTDFQRKRQEAISGRITSIYSPPFYTSKTGYKMCVRLYLNGDGMGKGSHISLFFVVMRGQYDALLRWPFRQKVNLMLLEQSGKEQHVMDAFRPDPTSSSFKRPTTEMNIASGCPLFMDLTQLDSPLHAFVKDDTAFIKIGVSLEGI